MIDRNYLKQKKVIISLVGLFLLIVGNFLPLIEISSKTISYDKTFPFFQYEGKYIIILVAIALLLLLLKEAKTTLLPILAISIILGYVLIHKSSIYTECDLYRDMFSWGIGFYTLIIGNIFAYVAPIGTFLKEKVSISIKITKK